MALTRLVKAYCAAMFEDSKQPHSVEKSVIVGIMADCTISLQAFIMATEVIIRKSQLGS